MSIRDAAAALLGLGVLVVAGLVGTAVQRTWTSTHTTAALVGGLLILGLAAVAMSNALGVALADRRQQTSPPSVTVTGAHGQADPMAAHLMMLRLLDQTMKVQGQMERRGMLPAAHPADGLGDWRVTDYAVPDGPANRWEDRA